MTIRLLHYDVPTAEIMQRRLDNSGMIMTAESEELLHDVILTNCTKTSLDNDLEGLRKIKKNFTMRELRFAQRCCWGFESSGTWRCVLGRVVPDVSKHCGAFVVKKLWTLLIYVMKWPLTLFNPLFAYFTFIDLMWSISLCKQVQPRSIFPFTTRPITMSYHSTDGSG